MIHNFKEIGVWVMIFTYTKKDETGAQIVTGVTPDKIEAGDYFSTRLAGGLRETASGFEVIEVLERRVPKGHYPDELKDKDIWFKVRAKLS